MLKKLILFCVALIALVVLSFTLFVSDKPGITVTEIPTTKRLTMFQNQCIDTMKVSRDRARELAKDPKTEQIIHDEMERIANLGATCVAIDTPYDEEFVPYLTMWVNEARKQQLAVWFRGNWSSWEGWFSYPTNLTPEQHTQKTVAFIKAHADLFADGDSFTASVEPENGHPFKPVDSAAKQQALRTFLIREQQALKAAFTSIGKEVETSWVSMSGGVAKGLINEPLHKALDETVTLDHYVRTPEEMTEYIDLFTKKPGHKVMLGEFGAPIPDLNGAMDENEQAAFVDLLLFELMLSRTKVVGVNYWTLTESSTALLSKTNTLLKAGTVLRNYYIPGKVTIHATDGHRRPLVGVIATIRDNEAVGRTDKQGSMELLLPAGEHTLTLRTTSGKILTTNLTLRGNDTYEITAVF